jgi:hypothetical protein
LPLKKDSTCAKTSHFPISETLVGSTGVWRTRTYLVARFAPANSTQRHIGSVDTAQIVRASSALDEALSAAG